MRNPRSFAKPLAMGAPTPLVDNPVRPSRMIHFFDPSNPRMATKVPDLVGKLDVLLANLEDAIEADNKIAAREGLVKIARDTDFGEAQFWVRINSLDSPWVLDDLIRIVTEVGDKIDVIMVPKVEGPWDIHYVDQLLAQLEAKGGVSRPILVHAILETALGVANVEEIVSASPRIQGISLGPADLAASRRMKTTRVGGGHPGYVVRVDPDPENADAPRPTAQQDLWHYTMARMVDACAATGALAYYGPFGDIGDPIGCEDQFRNAFLLGCVGAWSLHPKQIEIARRVFSPPPDEVLWAKRVIEEMGDGTGTVMIDGKMQDDATVKQCRVMVESARLIAKRDAEYAEAYGFSAADLDAD
jgi:malyl-CoA/(S)-citramalyl-CoA lyase